MAQSNSLSVDNGFGNGWYNIATIFTLLLAMPIRNTADVKRTLSLRLANSHSLYSTTSSHAYVKKLMLDKLNWSKPSRQRAVIRACACYPVLAGLAGAVCERTYKLWKPTTCIHNNYEAVGKHSAGVLVWLRVNCELHLSDCVHTCRQSVNQLLPLHIMFPFVG